MHIALRMPWVQFKDEERLTRLISFLARNGEGVKEIVFFTEHIHGYLPISAYRERLPALARALDAVRSLGFRAGINILNTLGQFDESPDLLPPMDVPPMVGLDGEVAGRSPIPGCSRGRRGRDWMSRKGASSMPVTCSPPTTTIWYWNL